MPWLGRSDRDIQGNLRLMSSMFGTGFLLDGQHPEIKGGVMVQIPDSNAISRSEISIIKGLGVKSKVTNRFIIRVIISLFH